MLFVRSEHPNRWTRQRLDGPADLVVEVLSEDTATEDLGRKREEYGALGVAEYFMIDSRHGRRQFHHLRLNGAGEYEPGPPDKQVRDN